MNPVQEAIVSDCGRFKVDIVRRPGGGFQVITYRWTEDWLEDHKLAEYWADISATVTLTDTLERARQLARERLAFHAS